MNYTLFQSFATCGLRTLCSHWICILVIGEPSLWCVHISISLGAKFAALCLFVCIEWHACVGWRTLRHRRTPTKLIWSHSDWLVTLLLPLLQLLPLYTTSAPTNTRSAMTTTIAYASTTTTTSFGLVSHPSVPNTTTTNSLPSWTVISNFKFMDIHLDWLVITTTVQ